MKVYLDRDVLLCGFRSAEIEVTPLGEHDIEASQKAQDFYNDLLRSGGEALIMDCPVAKLEIVQHGFWKGMFAGRAICSVCDKDQEVYTFVGNVTQKYCANCGAKMDLQ